MAAFGARVEFGRDFDEAKHEAYRVATADGWHFAPSFHRDLVAGVASYALELFRSVSHLDAIYVGVGMGSGISGLITVRDLLGLNTEIVGVSAAEAPATALSLRQVDLWKQSLHRPLPIVWLLVSPTVRQSQRSAGARLGWCRYRRTRSQRPFAYTLTTRTKVVEGAAPLAALLRERERMAGKNVALVLGGGNIDRARFAGSKRKHAIGEPNMNHGDAHFACARIRLR